MTKVVGRARIMIVLIVILAAGTLFFVGEYVLCAKDWVMHEGSPHVYTAGVGTGYVTDRDGILLLDTMNGRVYTENETLRKAIIHWLGDREGNIPTSILTHYKDEIAGFNLIGGVYDYGETGGQVTLTISAKLQMAALEALGDKKGTLAIYNYKTGEILCAVSTPTFDPDDIPDIAGDTTGAWEGAYVNRFLKSAYTPGSIFKIVTAIAALETIPDIQSRTFHCDGETVYHEEAGDKVTCLGVHGDIGFQEAFTRSCNCAFAQIADELGGLVLQQYAERLGITGKLSFDGVTTTAGRFEAANAADVMVAWSAIGQYTDLVNPCQFMTLMGTIASGGMGVEPYIVSSITGGSWSTHSAVTVTTERILSTQTAVEMQKLMRNNVINYYGDENFPGFSVCAKTGTAEVGEGKESTSMLAGFLTDEDAPLAFIISVEEGGSGRQTCIPILAKMLAAYKDTLGE